MLHGEIRLVLKTFQIRAGAEPLHQAFPVDRSSFRAGKDVVVRVAAVVVQVACDDIRGQFPECVLLQNQIVPPYDVMEGLLVFCRVLAMRIHDVRVSGVIAAAEKRRFEAPDVKQHFFRSVDRFEGVFNGKDDAELFRFR